MTTSIGPVTLDHDQVWSNKEKYKDLNMKVYEAVNGALNISQAGRGAHFPIVLESNQKTGWLKGSTVEALRALSAVPGATHILNINGNSFTVYFDNSNGPAVDMDYLIDTSAPGGDTWYVGKISLICTGV